MEQETVQDALPGHIGLIGLKSNCVKELLKVLLNLAETLKAEIRYNTVDHNQLLECDPLVIN